VRHRGGTAAKRPSRERERPKTRCPHARTAAAMRPVRYAASERTDRRRSGKDTDGMKHAPAQRLRRRREVPAGGKPKEQRRNGAPAGGKAGAPAGQDAQAAARHAKSAAPEVPRFPLRRPDDAACRTVRC